MRSCRPPVEGPASEQATASREVSYPRAGDGARPAGVERAIVEPSDGDLDGAAGTFWTLGSDRPVADRRRAAGAAGGLRGGPARPSGARAPLGSACGAGGGGGVERLGAAAGRGAVHAGPGGARPRSHPVAHPLRRRVAPGGHGLRARGRAGGPGCAAGGLTAAAEADASGALEQHPRAGARADRGGGRSHPGPLLGPHRAPHRAAVRGPLRDRGAAQRHPGRARRGGPAAGGRACHRGRAGLPGRPRPGPGHAHPRGHERLLRHRRSPRHAGRVPAGPRLGAGHDPRGAAGGGGGRRGGGARGALSGALARAGGPRSAAAARPPGVPRAGSLDRSAGSGPPGRAALVCGSCGDPGLEGGRAAPQLLLVHASGAAHPAGGAGAAGAGRGAPALGGRTAGRDALAAVPGPGSLRGAVRLADAGRRHLPR